MAGLYIHIPFCRKACNYCNFHFSTQLKYLEPMVDAICQDIEQNHSYLSSQPLNTIYFGGGSPSLLPQNLLGRIIDSINRHFNTDNIIEITLEANPEDIHKENLFAWESMGIQRLSMGIQSLQDSELLWMNRSHTASQSKKALSLAQSSGFFQLSLDLIYGSEKKTMPQWQSELKWILDTGISHLSCYALTIEEKTVFGNWVNQKKMQPVADDHASQQFNHLCNWAIQNNWDHYEISNLCKEGKRAIHNSHYWQGKMYLGIGPAAHSFNGNSRRWNVANNMAYIKQITQKLPAWEEEILSEKDIFNEYLLTQLRLLDGADLGELEKLHPGYLVSKQNTIDKLIQKQTLYIHNNRLAIQPTARFLSDAITIEMMID
ncbi:MAG: radical SAM family heme chaperone HemW [Bacteroidetes bacterium]|nr:radical SAM family heme chaperone HemW [Bacteroidota bacterium]